jgi:hypothetical protein
MPTVVAVLCAFTSLAVATLLFRGYASSKVRLLFWSALCFSALTIANILLIVDYLTPPSDLSIVRSIPTLIGVSVLLFGLVKESRR